MAFCPALWHVLHCVLLPTELTSQLPGLPLLQQRQSSFPQLLFLSGSDWASCITTSSALLFTKILNPPVFSNFWHISFIFDFNPPDVGSQMRVLKLCPSLSGARTLVSSPSPAFWQTYAIFHSCTFAFPHDPPPCTYVHTKQWQIRKEK